MRRAATVYRLMWCILIGCVLIFSGPGALVSLRGQEVILPPGRNPHLSGDHLNQTMKDKGNSMQTSSIQQLELPFFDDFSSGGPVPDKGLWSDRDAFVNHNFCINPVSIGVATLDALASDGSLYPNATLSPATFEADRLTSQPINLEYDLSDSLYFSFLYQPGGLGDLPEGQDSLIVDFYAPDSSIWITVWQTEGSDMQPFRQVMIPVRNEWFLRPGFRFRFRNLASLSRSNDYPDLRNNVDFWHIDYIRLDRQRFAGDTILRDVAFHEPLGSFLKVLTSVPWPHFEAAYNTVLDPIITARYRNNDSITRNVTRSLLIEEPLYGERSTPESPTAQDLPASLDTSVAFNYIYPLDFQRGDSALIRLKASIRTDAFDPRMNDTVVHDQYFRDYYSYDDGTAEAGYGLRGGGTANGLAAMRFNSYLPDLLGGVYIYFNQVYDSLNLGYYFNLLIWDDNEGVPGTLLWDGEEEYRVRYTTAYPGFVKYEFSTPVEVDGPFYAGWRQYNEYLLNVGLDLNHRPSPHVMFYNIQGTWQPSDAPGVMLIRPFLHREPTGNRNSGTCDDGLKLFPNPAQDRLQLILPQETSSSLLEMEIFDSSGRLAGRESSREPVLDVSFLPNGIYYLRLKGGNRLYRSKFLIQR